MSEFYRKKSRAFFAALKNNLFYVLLVLTVVSVCVFGMVSVLDIGTSPKNKVEEENKPHQTVKEDPNKETDGKTNPDPIDDKPQEPVVNPTPIYRAPLDCAATIVFSGTVPVFSDTLGDWRLHQGLDYVTEGSVVVSATADGTVEDVYEDDLMGNTVVILHADGVRSVYQSLADNVRVKKGQEVSAGDPVGFTGISAETECASGTHLHFAMIVHGRFVDPLAKLAEKQ